MMLVLIVVVAASSFAIFFSQYQEAEQTKRLDDQKRAQEKLQVISIVSELVEDDMTSWQSFNFTIASLHNERSEIIRMAINDQLVWQFDVWRVDPYSGKFVKDALTAEDRMTIGPREEVSVLVDVETGMYNAAASFSTNGFVKMDILTGMSNSFSKSFIPPSAVATHSIGSMANRSEGAKPGALDYYVTLNGGSSVANSGAYIVSWNWTVESTNKSSTWKGETFGKVVRMDLPCVGGLHVVTLTVTDNFGMTNISTYRFYQ